MIWFPRNTYWIPQNDQDFMNNTTTGEECWMYGYNLETKSQLDLPYNEVNVLIIIKNPLTTEEQIHTDMVNNIAQQPSSHVHISEQRFFYFLLVLKGVFFKNYNSLLYSFHSPFIIKYSPGLATCRDTMEPQLKLQNFLSSPQDFHVPPC